MPVIYPSLSSSPYDDFEPYQSLLIGLIQDALDRDEVWETGTAEENRAWVQELIEYIISMPQQTAP